MTRILDYELLIGWDWGHVENALCIRTPDGDPVEQLVLETKAQLLHEWAAEKQAAHGPGRIAVGIERLDLACVEILKQYEVFDLYQFNPQAVSAYRKSFAVADAKDDAGDADLLCNMLVTHRHKAKRLDPADPVTRPVKVLAVLRRKKVDERTRWLNRLADHLRISHPVILELFSTENLARPVVLELLGCWPRQRNTRGCWRPRKR